jgi:hypothetical protein
MQFAGVGMPDGFHVAVSVIRIGRGCSDGSECGTRGRATAVKTLSKPFSSSKLGLHSGKSGIRALQKSERHISLYGRLREIVENQGPYIFNHHHFYLIITFKAIE